MTPLSEAATASALVAKWEHGDDAHRAWLRSVAVPDIVAALASARAEGARVEREALSARIFALAYPHPDAFKLTMLERVADAGSRLDQIAELTRSPQPPGDEG
jgi:hypothetical protein